MPLTREDMKKALEDSKRSVPRLPLPPLSEEEKAKAAEASKDPAARTRGLGAGIVNNGRMRSYYLSDYADGSRAGLFGLGGFGGGSSANRGGAGAGRDPGPSLDNAFQTMMFWIVSRGNNCTYCMGHQESKLAAAGLTDDQIAALDGDWSEFDEPKRAAFAFAKKLTFEPHAITDADIAALRKHYDDARITEIILAVAGFNSMNRWTGPLRIPQEERHVYLKPTSESFAARVTRVAPVPEGSADLGVRAPDGASPPAARVSPRGGGRPGGRPEADVAAEARG